LPLRYCEQNRKDPLRKQIADELGQGLEDYFAPKTIPVLVLSRIESFIDITYFHIFRC